MAETLMQRVVEALPFLDDIAEEVQPKVQEAVAAGGTTARNVLDGVWLEAPLHPALTDVPVGAWTAALVFDGLDVATAKKPIRHAADASLVFGTLGALGAAVAGLSDWRYLSGGARRMGVAHGLLNIIGLILSIVSLALRATGRRNAGRLWRGARWAWPPSGRAPAPRPPTRRAPPSPPPTGPTRPPGAARSPSRPHARPPRPPPSPPPPPPPPRHSPTCSPSVGSGWWGSRFGSFGSGTGAYTWQSRGAACACAMSSRLTNPPSASASFG